MKKLLFASALVVMTASLFTACTRSARTTSAHFLNASSSGIGSFTSSGSSVTTGGAVGAKIVITGVAISGAQMQVILNPYAGITGTFPIVAAGDMMCQYTASPISSSITYSVHGSITVTAVSPDVVGTFTFTAQDSSIVTGSFNAPHP